MVVEYSDKALEDDIIRNEFTCKGIELLKGKLQTNNTATLKATHNLSISDLLLLVTERANIVNIDSGTELSIYHSIIQLFGLDYNKVTDDNTSSGEKKNVLELANNDKIKESVFQFIKKRNSDLYNKHKIKKKKWRLKWQIIMLGC